MKKIYILFLCFAFPLWHLYAQTTDWIFHNYHHTPLNEDKAYCVIQTMDGGYVFTGKYGSNGNGNADIYVGKLSTSGALLWSKTYGDSLGDEGRSIKELADGSFILSGFTFRMGDTANATSYKSLLMKLDSNGDSVWTKQFRSPGVALGDGFGGGVEATYDGGFVMVGKYPNGSNGNDFYIVKADANGDSVWAKLYGGTGADIPRSVHQTADSGLIIAGTTKSYGPNASSGNMWLIKTNAMGDTLWTSVIGDVSEEECFSARQTKDGGYILAGRTGDNSVLASELYAVKTDAAGKVKWSQTFGLYMANDFGRDIVQTIDGGYAMTGARFATHGYFLGPPQLMYIVKMDSTGGFQWDKELGFDNTPNGATGLSIQQTADYGLIVAGFDQPDTASNGTEEIRTFIVKLSPLPTGILNSEKQETNECFFYPNPFSEATNLLLSDAKENTTLNIYNAEGKQIICRKMVAHQPLTINKNELSQGIYFYRLSSKGNEVMCKGKFIVQ